MRNSSTGNSSTCKDLEALREEVGNELDQLEIVVEELEAITEDVGAGPGSLRDRAAASSFLASFYMGVENVLKRIVRYHGLELPRSERWHVELFERFCAPREEPGGEKPPEEKTLPVLFEGEQVARMDAYRRFRHVIHHGYERDLDYARMRPGIEGARRAFERFRSEMKAYLKRLGEQGDLQ